MWCGEHECYSGYTRFFYSELEALTNKEHLYREAYFLIKHIGLSYSDVKRMTREERIIFQNLFLEERKKEKEIIES